MKKRQVASNTHISNPKCIHSTMADPDRSLHAAEGAPVPSKHTNEVNKLRQTRVPVAMVSFGAASAKGTV